MVTAPIIGYGGFGWMGALYPLFSLVVIAVIVVVVVKGISQWHSNNQAPRLTVAVIVVAKRADTQIHHHGSVEPATGFHTTTSTTTTTYYATFQVESGDRMEFVVPDGAYGQLAEGDRGLLTFQGTRYLGFVRDGEIS